MNQPSPVTFSVDAEGIGWITFDDPTSRANVFNPATQSALAAALHAADASPARAVVIHSAKDKIFIAGADLKWLSALPDAAAATEFAREGQALFARIAHFRVPVVAAIHGACAGGGLELALACHWRIATDAPATQIGLPETSIGTIPGWGGSVRLPRLIGVKPALDHILRGQLIPAAEALKVGIINDVVPAAELKQRAADAALKLATARVPAIPTRAVPNAELFGQLRASVSAKTRGQQPALVAAIDVVEQTYQLPEAQALPVEARIFGTVTAGEVCKAMVSVFFLRDSARKRDLAGWFDRASESAGAPAAPIQVVGVVGAGVMGSGIAQWLAARGLKVILRDVEPTALARGIDVIRGLNHESLKRGKISAEDMPSVQARISTTTTWEGFSVCDLVIEAIVENVAAKQKLFSELAAVVRADAILASNTSALPIEDIAGHVPNPGRTLGIHFFNPVSRMALVELILAPATSVESASRALAFVKALGKSPVICRSSPGFLVTRVLFFYLNAAVRLWEQGVLAEEIDGAMRDFGWPMGPLRLIDEVGVDVTEFIFGEIAHYFPTRFTPAEACGRLLAAGLKGRKNGTSRGFYTYAAGTETINETEARELAGIRATRPDVDGAATRGPDIVEHLMQVMIEEAQRCLDEGVVRSPDDIDFALLTGAGFPVFRGGLMHYARYVAAEARTPS